MLNTKSCTTSFLVWCAVFLILGIPLWDFMGWPAPHVAIANFITSPAAREIERFQTLIGLVLGLWGLGGAYWFTSWQGRKMMHDRSERAVRNLASTMSLELGELGAQCDQAAAHLVRLVEMQERKPAGQTESAATLLARAGEDRVQLGQLITSGLGTEHLVRLGRNGASGVKLLRGSIDALVHARKNMPADSAPFALVRQYLMAVARAHAEIGLKCERLQPLFSTLAKHGVDPADEGELPVPAGAAEAERYLEQLLARYHKTTELEPRSAAA